MKKINLSFWQIWNMNVGFFGIQFSFGLQQSAVNPIFSFLGAHHDQLPLLNLAGPVTGLIIQPLIGAISDKTWSPRWGRRKPFFLIGAMIASLGLFIFPFSPTLWFAVGMLWILDAANNTAMEPYRAFIGDKLPEKQVTKGFQMQSLFVGAGITVANFSLFLFQKWFSNSEQSSEICAADQVTQIPQWVYFSFFLGAIASIGTVLWSVLKTPEDPPSEDELKEMKRIKSDHSFFSRVIQPFTDIGKAVFHMPRLLWQLAAVYLFQWYALFIYWQFVTPMLRKTLYGVTNEDYVRFETIKTQCAQGMTVLPEDLSFAEHIQHLMEQALAQTGLMNGTYNFVTMIVALMLVPFALRYSNKAVYVASLFMTSLALISLPYISNEYVLLVPMILLGIGWATMMGIPYSMVNKVVPEEKRGVYMGIVNMMIVIPMGIQTLSFGPIVKHLLNDSAVNAILFAGVFFLIAGFLALRLNGETKREVIF